jgi:hypothetical protein
MALREVNMLSAIKRILRRLLPVRIMPTVEQRLANAGWLKRKETNTWDHPYVDLAYSVDDDIVYHVDCNVCCHADIPTNLLLKDVLS